MLFRILLYISLMFVGVLIGRSGKLSFKILNKLDLLQLICLLFLLYAMGISMGTNEKVMTSFSSIGFKAAIFAIFSIVFSVLFVFVFNKIMNKFIINKNKIEEAGDSIDI